MASVARRLRDAPSLLNKVETSRLTRLYQSALNVKIDLIERKLILILSTLIYQRNSTDPSIRGQSYKRMKKSKLIIYKGLIKSVHKRAQ